MVSEKWLLEKLNELRKITETISQINKDTFYSARLWSPLKLISLMLYLRFYSTVIPKYFERMYFIDVLADSGINKIKETGDLICGSPIVAVNSAYNPFSEILLIENDVESAKTLELRMNKVCKDYKLFIGDCNEKIKDVISILKGKSHYLAFVDNEGCETSWDMMKKLLSFNGDLIINFQTQEIRRLWGRCKLSDSCYEVLTKYYGDESWTEARDENDLLSCYLDKIKSTGKSLTETIRVRSKTGAFEFHYDLIFATKPTRTGSPWFEPVLGHLKRQTEKHTGKTVKNALDVLAGRSKTVDMFI